MLRTEACTLSSVGGEVYAARLVVMPMVNIGKMRVGVLDRLVNVGVGMRFVAVPVGVHMLMMRIVEMRMFVF